MVLFNLFFFPSFFFVLHINWWLYLKAWWDSSSFFFFFYKNALWVVLYTISWSIQFHVAPFSMMTRLSLGSGTYPLVYLPSFFTFLPLLLSKSFPVWYPELVTHFCFPFPWLLVILIFSTCLLAFWSALANCLFVFCLFHYLPLWKNEQGLWGSFFLYFN